MTVTTLFHSAHPRTSCGDPFSGGLRGSNLSRRSCGDPAEILVKESKEGKEPKKNTLCPLTGTRRRKPPTAPIPPALCRQAVAIWNDVCGDLLPKVAKLNGEREKHLRARMVDDFHYDVTAWRDFCQRVRRSPFLTGQVAPRPGQDNPFTADFDWCIKLSRFNRIQEGNYDARASSRPDVTQWSDRLAVQHAERHGLAARAVPVARNLELGGPSTGSHSRQAGPGADGLR